MLFSKYKSMKPQAAICEGCDSLQDTIQFVNGDETQRLCDQCIAEQIVDIVMGNDEFSVVNHGDKLEVC